MKITTILLLVGAITALLFIAAQAYSGTVLKDIEKHSYSILRTYDDFEVREYDAANFSYVTLPSSSYKASSGTGFSMLAGYIFGGNESKEKIAMTSPVTMEMGDSIEMAFMLPDGYELDELPAPQNSNVSFKHEPGKTMAAIRFGGWASDERIADYTDRLKSALEREGIKYSGKFVYMGYNPPFTLVNRRNEIAVEVEYQDDQKNQ